MEKPSVEGALEEQFQRLLLPNTLERALKHVPVYRDLVVSGDAEPTLEQFPLVRKDDIKQNEDLYRDESLGVALVKHTGGTTGRGLSVHRSREEIEFCEAFFSEIIEQELGESAGRLANQDALCISMYGHLHGEVPLLPFPGRVFTLNNDDMFWDIEALISEPESILGEQFGHVILSGFESQLRLFTARLRERGFDFARSRISSLYITGDHISPRLARWYKAHWQVDAVSRYGMTEMIGGARQCNECGWYHFEPNVIPELFSYDGERRLQNGYGMLVVTCLYPFVQKQPLIRYWTDDVVEVQEEICSSGKPAFRFMGRRLSCLIDQENHEELEPLIKASELYDILDEFPDIGRSKQFETNQDIVDAKELGYLKFEVKLDKSGSLTRVTVRIELFYNPSNFQDRATRLRQQIKDQVLSKHLNLANQAASGLLDFEIILLAPGRLKENMIAQIE